MPRFRPVDPKLAGVPITPDEVRRLAAEAMAPRHFFVAPDLDLEWVHVPREEISWEIFRGRLLDPAHTRERAIFEAWSVYETSRERQRADEPVLSLKLDEKARVLYVVRGLECYVWEGYDSGGGVILSREVRKWVRELVATLRFDQLADLDELQDEIICGLYHAVVGTSRLPLTSVEAPLPAFSFGKLFYSFREYSSEQSWENMLQGALPSETKGKLLQVFLLSTPMSTMTQAELDDLRTQCRFPRPDLIRWLEALFNDISLTPWTEVTGRALTVLRWNSGAPFEAAEDAADFLARFLRKIARHLTAYDLVTFHHRGANYPDALLLDKVLNWYRVCIEIQPEQFMDAEDDTERDRQAKRLRRRALRQAWLIRRFYEGHPVPDLPTSPGENNRVLPPSHPRVPEEQILQTARRTRRLYDGHPFPTVFNRRSLEVVRRSVADLAHPDELRELGLGIFLDRPLSARKAPGEPDSTPLLASLAFSRSIAVQRVNALAKDELFMFEKPVLDRALRTLLDSPPRGLPLDRIGGASRPGAVSLSDARLAAPDFEFLETLPSSRAALFTLFDWSGLPSADYRLFARDPAGPGILVYDTALRPRLQIEAAMERGFVGRAGVEYPAAGLLVTRLWEETADGFLREHDLRAAPIRLPPR